MGSSACLEHRTEFIVVLVGVFALLPGCATQSSARVYDAAVELPPGFGREILVQQCLTCHELGALELFSDFYDRELWRSLIISMRANGAQVSDSEVEVLAGYLATNFGIE